MYVYQARLTQPRRIIIAYLIVMLFGSAKLGRRVQIGNLFSLDSLTLLSMCSYLKPLFISVERNIRKEGNESFVLLYSLINGKFQSCSEWMLTFLLDHKEHLCVLL